MKKTEVLEYFKTQTAAAEAAGVGYTAVQNWRATVPLRAAMRIEERTRGRLKPDWSAYGLAPRSIKRA